jgi:16S rRNA U516 pseudouridylate synthase RsuA-like enzyme
MRHAPVDGSVEGLESDNFFPLTVKEETYCIQVNIRSSKTGITYSMMMILFFRSFCKFLANVNAREGRIVTSKRLGFVCPVVIFLMHVCSVLPVFSQLENDGTGIVNGYQIGPRVDLRSADLRGADLKGANLENSDLREANLEGADLSMASLIGCNLDGVNLSGARLNGVRISDSNVAPAISGAGRATYLKVVALEDLGEEHEAKLGLLIDDGENREVRLGAMEEIGGEHEAKLGLLIDDGENREVRLGAMEEIGGEHEAKLGLLIDDGENREVRLGAMEEVLNRMNTKLEQLAVQIPVLESAIAERDEKIALLEKRPTMEQLMEGRAAGVLLQINEEGKGEVTLSLRVEQSEDLLHWTPVEELIKHTLPVPEGKRFYRFALAR